MGIRGHRMPTFNPKNLQIVSKKSKVQHCIHVLLPQFGDLFGLKANMAWAQISTQLLILRGVSKSTFNIRFFRN